MAAHARLKNEFTEAEKYHTYLVKRKSWSTMNSVYERPHDKTNKMVCAHGKDSDQPGHAPSLIRVFAVHSIGSS